MSPLDAIENLIRSGTPFTYDTLTRINNSHGGVESKDRLADRTLQRYRRNGHINFTRHGREVVWSLTEVGRLAYGV